MALWPEIYYTQILNGIWLQTTKYVPGVKSYAEKNHCRNNSVNKYSHAPHRLIQGWTKENILESEYQIRKINSSLVTIYDETPITWSKMSWNKYAKKKVKKVELTMKKKPQVATMQLLSSHDFSETEKNGTSTRKLNKQKAKWTRTIKK